MRNVIMALQSNSSFQLVELKYICFFIFYFISANIYFISSKCFGGLVYDNKLMCKLIKERQTKSKVGKSKMSHLKWEKNVHLWVSYILPQTFEKESRSCHIKIESFTEKKRNKIKLLMCSKACWVFCPSGKFNCVAIVDFYETVQNWSVNLVTLLRLSLLAESNGIQMKIYIYIYITCRYIFQDKAANPIYPMSQFCFELKGFALLWKLV